jgi:hypothetical protein
MRETTISDPTFLLPSFRISIFGFVCDLVLRDGFQTGIHSVFSHDFYVIAEQIQPKSGSGDHLKTVS